MKAVAVIKISLKSQDTEFIKIFKNTDKGMEKAEVVFARLIKKLDNPNPSVSIEDYCDEGYFYNSEYIVLIRASR